MRAANFSFKPSISCSKLAVLIEYYPISFNIIFSNKALNLHIYEVKEEIRYLSFAVNDLKSNQEVV